ncbi:hypothetical protein MNBD_PLANCTO02-1641 [hydrothermal vent metagenome]|uniref:Multidrug resistance protein MdtA-like barrel-sandwich hybrid domain-containing protein n=1 Tax=hydrothermal vent metagenome TaxID=652676 RepID=A0A3B1DAS5_9ZZZZ
MTELSSLPSPSKSSVSPVAIPWRRIVVSLLLGVGALGIGGLGYVKLSALKQPPSVRIPLPKVYVVETYSVKPESLREQITAFGTARADHEVVISAQVTGEVIKFSPRLGSLEVGQFVQGPQNASLQKKSQQGEFLLQIDPKVYQQQVEQAEKQLAIDAASIARLNQEELNNERNLLKSKEDYKEYLAEYNRVKNLRAKNIIAESQLTRAKLELGKYQDSLNQRQNKKNLIPIRKLVLEKRLESHQNDFKMAKFNLAHATVTAPMSGSIREVMVERGTFVRVGEPLLKLTDTSRIEIPVPVTLSDYAKVEQLLQQQQKILVRIAPHETAPYFRTGYITRIAPVANTATRTVNLFVDVKNDKEALHQDRLFIYGSLGSAKQTDKIAPVLPGMFLHTRIEGPVLKNVIIIPREAILHQRVFVTGKLDLNAEIKKIEKKISALKTISDKTKQRKLNELKRQKRALSAELDELPAKNNGKVTIARKRKVQVQRTLQSFAIIHSGLKQGEQIILTNLDIMHEGARIRVGSKRTLNEELQKQRIPLVRPLSPQK